jgi:hypothetical protein
LREGYCPNAKLHTADEVVKLVEAHLKKCAASGLLPYLTGSVTTGEVVYAWPEGDGKAGSGHESQATYGGEKNPLYNSSLTDEQIVQFLSELASELGEALGQTRVYVAYNGGMRILQREDTATPTGEKA